MYARGVAAPPCARGPKRLRFREPCRPWSGRRSRSDTVLVWTMYDADQRLEVIIHIARMERKDWKRGIWNSRVHPFKINMVICVLLYRLFQTPLFLLWRTYDSTSTSREIFAAAPTGLPKGWRSGQMAQNRSPRLWHSYPCPCPRQLVEETCVTKEYSWKLAELFGGRGMGMNITAQVRTGPADQPGLLEAGCRRTAANPRTSSLASVKWCLCLLDGSLCIVFISELRFWTSECLTPAES